MPEWWNGRRGGLKIHWMHNPWGFKSPFGHQAQRCRLLWRLFIFLLSIAFAWVYYVCLMAWLFRSFIFSIALAMDCLALSVADGLTIEGLKEKKWRIFFIAAIFGLFQGLFPLIGYLLGTAFSQWIDRFDHWIAFGLLLLIGGKMLFEGIRGIVKPEKARPKQFRYGSVLLQGVADSLDAFAIGITVSANIQSTAEWQNYVCFGIIALITFGISLFGLLAGGWINKLLKGRYSVTEIIGGSILVMLAIVLLLEGLHIISW